jgi:hypothetical protein
LHPVWPTIELHAKRLDRVASQQAGSLLEVVAGHHGDALALTIPLAEPGKSLRALLEGEAVRYYWVHEFEAEDACLDEDRVDLGVYRLLAESAAQ